MTSDKAKIRSMIQSAYITKSSDDDDVGQIGQIDIMGKTLNCEFIYPYGISANAPDSSMVLRFLMGGSAQNQVGIPNNPDSRFAGLKPWEVAVGNFLKKSKIFFDADGNIEIDSSEFDKKITIKNSNGFFRLEENGQFNANDNFTVDP